ncbi:MoxR family ATPase, partial [Vibrio sp. 1565-1]
DRFLLHLEVDYPDAEHELAILRINRGEAKGECSIERAILSQQDIFTARQEVLDIHMAEAIEQYIVRLVMATRQASEYDSELDKWLAMGVSPRATIALDRCARAHAWLAGRDFVSPEDVQAMAYPVLRHRLLLSYHAQAEGVTSNQVIDKLLSLVGSA